MTRHPYDDLPFRPMPAETFADPISDGHRVGIKDPFNSDAWITAAEGGTMEVRP